MKKYSITPLFVLCLAAFVLIDGTVFSLITASCALLHELGHVVAIRLLGGKTRNLKVGAKGAQIKTGLVGYKSEIKIALAGPLCSFSLFVIGFVFGFCKAFYLSNLALFILNVLPIYPLDGARALRCALCLCTDEKKAAFIIKIISFIFLLPLGVLSVIILVRSGYNLSLLIICIYLTVLQAGVFTV